MQDYQLIQQQLIKELSAGSASRNFNWNSNWKFIGEKPASIAGNKVAILSMTCFGAAETDIICSYGVQD